jgi:glycosyltransferase involved in cell wall biosynthesis
VSLRVLIVSGIWPPDVGGPASHGPELGQFLAARGNDVRAVTTCGPDGARTFGFPLRTARRDLPRVLRMPGGALALGRSVRGRDVIYATGMYHRAALAARLYRMPLVIKLVNDPAYERARNLGLFGGTLEEFQEWEGDSRVRALRRGRAFVMGSASRIVIPSRYLAEIARRWGPGADRITVIPNPAPPVDRAPDRDALRAERGLNGPTFAFAGRLVPQKNVPLAVSALAHVPGASLILVGDGEEQAAVEDAIAAAGVGERVRMEGALPRAEGIRWVEAADAAVLPSDWENFPHAAVEALAVGTPVIGTTVGGVPEIIEQDVNGILVPPGDEQALAGAMARVADDAEFARRLREGAEATAGRYSADRAFQAIERVLVEARDHSSSAASPSSNEVAGA